MRRLLSGAGVIIGIVSCTLGSHAVAQAKGSSSEKHEPDKAPWLEATLGAHAGAYLEARRFGPLVQAELEARAADGPARYGAEVGYRFDPFTIKTSSFDEDQVEGVGRLVQAMHVLEAFTEFQTRLKPRLRFSTRLGGDAWFPEVALDRRWRGKAESKLRFGALRGGYLSGAIGAQGKYYPSYFVAGRRIDQVEVNAEAELGVVFERNTKVLVRAGFGYIQYLEARYDAIRAGELEPASQSKLHLQRSLGVLARYGELRPFVFGARYEYRLNDSRHYDRRMTGRTVSGDLVAKFIPDYYDYARHETGADVELTAGRRFRAQLGADFWLRGFTTYEARDVNNVWTGELREDDGLELSAKLGFRLSRFELGGLDSALWLTGFGSRVIRRSNMQREVSLATNFDVTRVFVGLALEAR